MKEEDFEGMKEYFDNYIWSRFKKELQDSTKEDACFTCFLAGFEVSSYSFQEQVREAEKEVSNMSQEEIEEILKDANVLKESSGNSGKLWEDKTMVNGVWIDDKTGERIEEENLSEEETN